MIEYIETMVKNYRNLLQPHHGLSAVGIGAPEVFS
jgi:hypothetical protein